MLKPYKGIMPTLGDSVFVEESAQVVGDVHIGSDSSVWHGAVVRGDVNFIRIGERTSIQDNSVVHVTHDTHPTHIGDDVTVGHSVTLHGCTVGNRVLVGMGATILDGATIEDDCIIGAGALVTEGKTIPSGWLAVGSPARPVRQLTDEERAHLLESANNYLNYKNDYLEDN